MDSAFLPRFLTGLDSSLVLNALVFSLVGNASLRNGRAPFRFSVAASRAGRASRRAMSDSHIISFHAKKARQKRVPATEPTMASNDTANAPLHQAEQVPPSPSELSDASASVESTAVAEMAAKKLAQDVLVDISPSILQSLLPFAGLLVWPLMLTLPLLLTSPLSPTSYSAVFPSSWYEFDPTDKEQRPLPLGLTLGILAVAIGQVFVLIYFYLHKFGYLSVGAAEPTSIQSKGARSYEFSEGLVTHLSQPEGFVLLVTYLSVTWMFHLMPNSYYSFEGTILWKELALCLVIQDGIQFVMHRLEHVVSPTFYQKSHKPHHRFTNPRLFDAFNGSTADTVFMILIPLYTTANLVRTCNVWTYMAFGSTYANWLTLIHSEYVFPWDGAFRRLGFGTPADHHVHHKFFKYNYGHLFMWFDQLCGTYRHPKDFSEKAFNENV